MKIEYCIKTSEEYNAIINAIRKYNDIENPRIGDKCVIFRENDKVIAFSEIRTLNFAIDELCHIFVNENFRGKGYGKMLICELLKISEKPIKIMTIRADNSAMLHLAKKMRFEKIAQFISPISKKEIAMVMRNESENRGN